MDRQTNRQRDRGDRVMNGKSQREKDRQMLKSSGWKYERMDGHTDRGMNRQRD
jgi:hypothetical protein